MTRRLRHFAPALILVVAACSAAGSTPAPSAPAAPTAAAPTASAGIQTVMVKLTDALRMEPAQLTVKAGQSVRFMVTNTGGTDHEFYLGDEAAQEAHEMVMRSPGGMSHGEPAGISLKPGETKELVYTFSTAGAFVAGCHEPAHYAAGMKAAITVTN